jgi:hypothetical protein
MEHPGPEIAPLVIKDCALLAIATGRVAQNLKELRDQLLAIHPDSIYYHFWGGLLHTRFEEREYNNDFAAWARHGLHDKVLAERLSVVDAAAYPDLEELRRELVEVIEQRLDEREVLAWAPSDQQFEFIRSRAVIFRTERRFRAPAELAGFIGWMSLGSIFYHFIDARRRNPDRRDDFRNWLDSFGGRYAWLTDCLAGIDPYFTSLADLRARLAEAFATCLEEAPHG